MLQLGNIKRRNTLTRLFLHCLQPLRDFVCATRAYRAFCDIVVYGRPPVLGARRFRLGRAMRLVGAGNLTDRVDEGVTGLAGKAA